MRIPASLLIYILIVLPVTAAAESSWLYVQGDGGHTGHLEGVPSPAQLIESWTVTPENIVQKAMVIADGRVLTLDNDWTLRAIDLVSGTVDWRRDDIGLTNTPEHAAPLSSDGARVFMLGDRQVEGSDGILRWREHVIALDVTDGSIVWEKSHEDLAPLIMK